MNTRSTNSTYFKITNFIQSCLGFNGISEWATLKDFLATRNSNGRIIAGIGDPFPATHLSTGGSSVAPLGINLLPAQGNTTELSPLWGFIDGGTGNCHRAIAPFGFRKNALGRLVFKNLITEDFDLPFPKFFFLNYSITRIHLKDDEHSGGS